MTIPDDIIERYAIRCAQGNNGGEWASHYNEDQKNFWRKFVKDLIYDLTLNLHLLERLKDA